MTPDPHAEGICLTEEDELREEALRELGLITEEMVARYQMGDLRATLCMLDIVHPLVDGYIERYGDWPHTVDSFLFVHVSSLRGQLYATTLPVPNGDVTLEDYMQHVTDSQNVHIEAPNLPSSARPTVQLMKKVKYKYGDHTAQR